MGRSWAGRLCSKGRYYVSYESLKKRHRVERGGYPQSLSLRVHRALSWLNRAEQLQAGKDVDGQFIFLWIAFNAAYATEIDERYRVSAQVTSRAFLRRLVKLESPKRRVEHLVWDEFPGSIRVLLDNPYVFKPFWDFQAGLIAEDEWRRKFAAARRAAHRALSSQNTVTVLGIVLSRIYVLRNQIIHGGATWGSGVNRDQLRDCTNFMGKLVPVVIETMMDHPEAEWGEPCYPVVDSVGRGVRMASGRGMHSGDGFTDTECSRSDECRCID